MAHSGLGWRNRLKTVAESLLHSVEGLPFQSVVLLFHGWALAVFPFQVVAAQMPFLVAFVPPFHVA